jgi:methyl-accepting chemotaxis protein
MELLRMKMPFNTATIKFKVIATTSALLLLLVISSVFGIAAMNSIGTELDAIAEQDIPLTEKLTQVTLHQMEQAIQFERAARFAGLIRQDTHTADLFRKSIESFDSGTKRIEAELHEAELFAEAGMAKAHTPEEAKEFEHVIQAIQQIEREHKDFENHVHQAFASLEQGDSHAAETLAEKIEHEEEQLNHELSALLTEIEKFTAAAARKAEAHEHNSINIMSAIAVFSILLGMSLSWLTTRIISKGINTAVESAETIASGDLTQEVKSMTNCEIGRLLTAMETMRNKLVAMFTSIGGGATQLASAAEELAAITVQTTEGIRRQQSETDQVATAMNEMAATVDEVAKSAGTAADGAREADQAAKQGQQVVNDTIGIMGQVAANVETNANAVRKLNEDSDRIGVVLDVIRGIAEQTNLLALNAAIEAARAGEQGRGFAVVADEVRNLASKTQESTQEIQQVIEGLQINAREAVTAMDTSAEQTRAGVDKAAEAGTALETITYSVTSINDMNSQIASAAEQQSAVAKEIDRSIISISQVATETATGAEQLASASQELAQLSAGLQNMIAEFKVS